MNLSKYYSIWKINLINSLVYFTEFILNALFVAIIIFIFVNLWQVIYADKSVIEGFTIGMMIWYLVFTESIVTSQKDVVKAISDDIKSGQIAYSLNKPYDYIMFTLVNSLSQAFVSFLLVMVVGGVIAYTMIGGIHLALINLPIILLLALLALLLDFSIVLIIGLSAFWIEDATSIRWIYNKFVFTIGGMLVPLEILPNWLAKTSYYLPFSFIAYHPAKLFVNFQLNYFLKVLAIQIGYITLFIGIAYLIYRKAIKEVSINGG